MGAEDGVELEVGGTGVVVVDVVWGGTGVLLAVGEVVGGVEELVVFLVDELTGGVPPEPEELKDPTYAL